MPIERTELNLLNLKRKTIEVLREHKEDLFLLGRVSIPNYDRLLINGEEWIESTINKLRGGFAKRFPPRLISFRWKSDPNSLYDYPFGDIPSQPIGQISHKDGNGSKSPEELAEIRSLALETGAEIVDKSNGEYNTSVIKHKRWIWLGGAAAGIGLTALGIGTAYAVEHHKRKNKQKDKE